MAEKLLEIKNLHVLYKTDEDDVYALNGVDLDLEKGETLLWRSSYGMVHGSLWSPDHHSLKLFILLSSFFYVLF